MANIYLVLYNAVLCAGWTYVLLLTLARVQGHTTNDATDLAPTWLPWAQGILSVSNAGLPNLLCWLQLFQTVAIMEILHAAVGLVNSKVSLTVQQVFSRLWLVWGVVYLFPALAHYAEFTSMVFVWSLSEITRYSWYALKELGSVPSFLTWCRYSFFIVLYPVGVASETMLNVAALKGALAVAESSESPFIRSISYSYAVLLAVLIFAYVPLFPGLYFHMLAQRKKTLYPPRLPPVETNGIQFPKNEKGERSTTAVGQFAFAASVMGVNLEAAAAVLKEKNWRFGYAKHVVRNVEISCKSRETCVAVCKAGLNYLHTTFEFVRGDKTYKLSEAMTAITSTFPGQFTIRGTSTAPNTTLTVPYRRKPYPAKCDLEQLSGEELQKQLDLWVSRGTIEPSAKAALERVAKNGKQFLDLSNRYFVLLGAGAAMGPFEILLQCGANIIALDIDRKPVWQRLIATARKYPGSITFPLKEAVAGSAALDDEKLAELAGANLFTQTPEIANWLCDLFPDKEFTIGGYAYLDGELHVRVSLAMDAIMAQCIARRKVRPNLAYLCSPTDVFVCQPEAQAAMRENKKKLPLSLRLASVLRFFSKNFLVENARKPVKADNGEELFVVDGIVVPQGPNYALAKRLQHWRAMLAWSEGVRVSSNIAPSTATVSVVHNKQFAAAYGGFRFFPPMEVSYGETSNSLMGALLIHDVVNTDSKATPTRENPVKLFASGAFHFGIWRCAFKIGSIGEAATLLFYLKQYGLMLSVGAVGAVAAASYAWCDC